MKVYRFENDVNRYQCFFTEDENDEVKLMTDCTPLASTWEPPPVYIYMPRLKAGDLYNFHGGSLIFSPAATEKLRSFLEMAGELLPLPFESQVYTLLNVTECINCLDRKNTKWRYAEDSWPIDHYAFHRNRFSESDIFKIPETCNVEVLVLDREDGGSFVDALREHEIKGYRLELLWSA